MLAGQRLPEQHADRPDVARGGGVAAAQPLRRDVRERAGHVADRSERVRFVELRQSEVQQAHRDRGLVLHEHVRRLHVAMHDPEPVRVRQPVEDLGRRLDGVPVAQLAGAQRLAHRLALDVLVGDVDVAAVAAEVVRTNAALVAQPRRSLHLACRARGALALARHDLERHLETGALVAREPDGARAASPEWAQGAIPVENEVSFRKGVGGTRHVCRLFAAGNGLPSGRCDRDIPYTRAVP